MVISLNEKLELCAQVILTSSLAKILGEGKCSIEWAKEATNVNYDLEAT